jgi:hypothetical protein
LSFADSESWIPASQRLEARSASIRGETACAVSAKHARATLLDLPLSEALLISELLGNCLADLLRVIAALEDGR